MSAEAFGIQLMHELARRVIVDGPKSHDHAARPGDAKCALQAQHSFAVAQLSVAGIASGKNRPINSAKIERGDLLGGKNGLCRAVTAPREHEP